MKIIRSFRLFRTGLILAIASIAGHAEKTKTSEAILPPSNAVVTITLAVDEPAATSQIAADTEAVPARWLDIKDFTSEMRASFFAGLTRLEIILNVQVNELAALRANATDATGIKDLDAAIQEMRNARFFFKLTEDKLSAATARTWDRQKRNVGLAWEKSQETYAKIKTHGTI